MESETPPNKDANGFTTTLDSKMHWIGFLELLPIVIGAIATDNLKPFLFLCDYLLIGIVLCIIIAYIFKDEVPHQPISIANSEETKKQGC